MSDRLTMLLEKRLERLEVVVRRITQIETKPRLIIPGGGGARIIEIIVTAATTISDTGSPYDGMRRLTGTVQSPDCPNSAIWGDSVYVYEHVPLCLTGDETDEALVDRKAWAYEGVHQDMSVTAETGDLTPCHWVLMGICCPPE